MKFEMNGREYEIEEVDQSILNPNNEEDIFMEDHCLQCKRYT